MEKLDNSIITSNNIIDTHTKTMYMLHMDLWMMNILMLPNGSYSLNYNEVKN